MTGLIAQLKFGPNSQAEMSVHTQTQHRIFYLTVKIMRKMPPRSSNPPAIADHFPRTISGFQAIFFIFLHMKWQRFAASHPFCSNCMSFF